MKRIRLLVTIAIVIYTAVIGWDFSSLYEEAEISAYQTQEGIQLCSGQQQQGIIGEKDTPHRIARTPESANTTVHPHSSNHILYCGRKMVRCIMLMFRPPHLI